MHKAVDGPRADTREGLRSLLSQTG